MDPIVRFVRNNSNELRTGKGTIKEIFEIVFRNEGNIMAETSNTFRITEHTYGQVKKRIERAAANIARTFGSDNSFIGLYGENSLEWLVGFWAILMSGNRPYLVNLMQPETFSNGILSTLGAKAVIYIGKRPSLNAELAELSGLEEGEAALPSGTVFGNEIALTTSGTTMQEKICIYTGRELTEQIVNCDSIIDANPDIKTFYHGRLKMLMFLPLYHIFGLEAAYLWFAFGNITFVFLPSMAPEAILHTIRRHEVTHIFAVPLFWHTVERAVNREVKAKGEKTWNKFQKGLRLSEKLQSAFPRLGKKIASRLLSEVRREVFGESVIFCISGGSWLRDSALRLMNCLGYSLYNGYGMSEIGITSVELSMRIKDRLLGSVGKPFESVEYRLGDDGRLFVRGASICRKIIVDGKPMENEEWFDTGDIMRRDASGRYYVEGRRSDVVYSDNGEKLNPDIAERELNIPNAANFTVMGDESNEKLMLIIQLPRTLVEAQMTKLRDAAEKSAAALPPAYRISRIAYTYDPLMEEGGIKVSREYVRRKLASGGIRLIESMEEARKEVGPVGSEVEAILVRIFAEVLGVPQENIRKDAHFMNDLGGSSLDYFTLIGEIDKRFDIRLDFSEGEIAYSVAGFAEIVERLIGEQ